MRKCPFWSTSTDRVNCYNTCPMYLESGGISECPFMELLPSNNKVRFLENINEDMFYSQDRSLNLYIDERLVNNY